MDGTHHLHAAHCFSHDETLFATLSYVWGPPAPQCRIQVNGDEIGIGRNLETALRYYRHAGWNMPLWVDALCINQGDLSERSAQVRFMDDIYSAAADTFVFLRPGINTDDNYTDAVMAMESQRFVLYKEPSSADPVSQSSWDGRPLAGLGTKIGGTSLLLSEVLQGACRLKINDYPSVVPRWGCQPRFTEDSNYPLQSLISDLNGFLDAPWWTRVWTI